jgi:hypothetical protein
MKGLANTALVSILFFFALSCSSYSIKNDIDDNSILSKIKSTGIIFRISNGSKLTKEELIRNCTYWLSVYQKKGNVTVITDASDLLTVFKNPQQRFYQLSNEDDYLKFKSLGVVNLYLQNNQNELVNIISKNNLDSIIIFEVYSIISTQMQFFEYESVLTIADANLNVGYLDHQSDFFESTSSSLDDLKNQTLDKINDRLIDNLRNVNLLGKLTEGEKKILNKDSGKSKAGIEEKTVVKQAEKPAEKKAEKPVEKPAEKQTEKQVGKTEEKPAVTSPENPKEIQKDVKPEEKQKDVKTETKAPDKPEKKAEVTPAATSPNEVIPKETASPSVDKPAAEK